MLIADLPLPVVTLAMFNAPPRVIPPITVLATPDSFPIVVLASSKALMTGKTLTHVGVGIKVEFELNGVVGCQGSWLYYMSCYPVL